MGWEGNSLFQVVVAGSGPGSGVFVYSPTVGAGNLVASVASVGLTDIFGNHYLPGVAAYSPTTAVSLFGGTTASMQFYSGSLAAGWTPQAATHSDASGNLFLIAHGAGTIQAQETLAANASLTVTGGETADTVAISSGQAAGGLLQVTNTTAGATSPLAQFTVQAANDKGAGFKVAGDVNNRLVLAEGTSSCRIAFGPGSGPPDSTIDRASANLLSVGSADWAVGNAGRGLRVKEGANAKQGTAVLDGTGHVTVADTAVTANSRILLTMQDNAQVGVPGWLRVSARVAGTSFTVTSSSGTDAGTFAYEIFEPA